MRADAVRAVFSTCRVQAASLEDFYSRYYRHDRYTGRGTEYVNAVLESGRDDLFRYGVTAVSSKDSVTGETVAWSPEGVK